MSLNCNYLQLDMLQLSEVTVGRSYSCLWLQLAKVTVVCGYSWQKLQLTFYTCLLTCSETVGITVGQKVYFLGAFPNYILQTLEIERDPLRGLLYLCNVKNSIGRRQPFGYNANGRVESCNATGEEESVDPLLSSLDNSRLTQLGSFISTDQVDIFLDIFGCWM